MGGGSEMNYLTGLQLQVLALGPVRNPYGEFPDYAPSLVRKLLSGLSGLSGLAIDAGKACLVLSMSDACLLQCIAAPVASRKTARLHVTLPSHHSNCKRLAAGCLWRLCNVVLHPNEIRA